MPLFLEASHHLTKVRIIIIIGAGAWGLFWIPLRALGESGISPAWSTILFYLIPTILMLPIGIYRWKKIKDNAKNLLLIGFFFGLGMAFYANAYFFTDVVRVLLLYYLLPVWGTILGRIFLSESITLPRIFAILLGFMGVLVIFGIGETMPWPRNMGDWMALSAAILWAIGSLLANKDENNHALDTTFSFFIWATLASLFLLIFPDLNNQVDIKLDIIFEVIPWLTLVALLLIIPTCTICIWGAGILTPGSLGVLYLSEISVGVIGATILTEEIFGIREFIGVVLISSAALCEALGHRTKKI